MKGIQIDKIRLNPTVVATVLSVIFLCVICRILNVAGIIDKDVDIAGAFIVCFGSALVMVTFNQYVKLRIERLLLCVGYLGRLVILFLDIYCYEYVHIFTSRSDTESFWYGGINIYQGIMVYRTNYPQVIAKLLSIWGENRLLCQYFNILCWVLTVTIFLLLCEKLKLNYQGRFWGLAYICLAPIYMMLSSILLRASLMVLFNTLSFYLMVRWSRKGKFVDIVISIMALIPSIWLHKGNIGLLGAYALFWGLFDTKKQKFRVGFKIVILGIGMLAVLYLFFYSGLKERISILFPQLYNIFGIQDRYISGGGSDYAIDLPYTTNLFVLFLYTIINVIMFYMSPMPWDWRGVFDIGAFFADGMMHFLILCFGIKVWYRGRKHQAIGFLGVICLLAVGFIFAWGVVNAGTALRHRVKFIGIESIMLAIFAENTKGRNYD